MKITLAQINPHIGNFPRNTRKILDVIREAVSAGSDLVIFPEMAVCGYPPLDLLERKEFIDRCREEINQIAQATGHVGVLVGAPTHNPAPAGKNLFNSVYFLYQGGIKQVFHKTLLPTYDIFDEYRYFEPNTQFNVLNFKGLRIAVTICEDLWDDQPVEQVFGKNRLYPVSPMEKLAAFRPGLIINMAASPFSYRKIRAKRDIFISKSRQYGVPVIYVNQTGAQTELIFEGASLVVNEHGQPVTELARFMEDIRHLDWEQTLDLPPLEIQEVDPIPLIHQALVLGIRDYFVKNGLKKAILGLSGGIDSAVVLAIAAEALGPENVHMLILPSRYTSKQSLSDAEKLVENLKVTGNTLPIEKIFRDFEELLTPVFKGMPADVTEENIQARIRAVLLMALANKFGYILLNTSNKSEAAVGYGTLYGDMCGGLSVLGDVYKTDVYKLARYINRNGEIIPPSVIGKPPSAELRENQKDTDSLPPYELLDQVLYHFIEQQSSPQEIVQAGFDRELVRRITRLVNHSEHKRYQAPPILRISSKAFGFGRRIPLSARYIWDDQ
ncbi:MAG TPA: NAD+ synthase [Bacteroidetes bacterium]|nr:NAD+ synthase [Bacteroidota bacterium]